MALLLSDLPPPPENVTVPAQFAYNCVPLGGINSAAPQLLVTASGSAQNTSVLADKLLHGSASDVEDT